MTWKGGYKQSEASRNSRLHLLIGQPTNYETWLILTAVPNLPHVFGCLSFWDRCRLDQSSRKLPKIKGKSGKVRFFIRNARCKVVSIELFQKKCRKSETPSACFNDIWFLTWSFQFLWRESESKLKMGWNHQVVVCSKSFFAVVLR